MHSGYSKGHKEMAGAYGLGKSYKPKLAGLPAGIKSGTDRSPGGKGNPCKAKNPCKPFGGKKVTSALSSALPSAS